LTGEAAVTIGATNQGMVAGDLVNTASRLQAVAPPGTLLVGEATERATSRAILFEPAGEQLLRGKAAPIPAWRALRVVAERGGRDELFAAWRTFFERLAGTDPVVLVFEDLQWADNGLLDFIDHLLDWSKSFPILVVTLARPELLDRRPGWGAGRRNYIALSL